MKTSWFIYAAFVLSVLLLAWMGAGYINRHGEQMHYTEGVEHTYRVIITLHACENSLLDAETKQRAYILTRDEHYRDAAGRSIRAADSTLSVLRRLTEDNPAQRVNTHLLALAIAGRPMGELVPERNDKARQEKLYRARLYMEKIHTYVQAIAAEENRLLDERSRAKNRYQALNLESLRYAFVFACVLCLAAAILIARELGKRITAQKMLETTIRGLKRSNEEVQQITWSASHDLQEPLRKIRTLSSLFTRKRHDWLDTEDKDILERIGRATEKLQAQIDELGRFASLLQPGEERSLIDTEPLFIEVSENVIGNKGTVLIHDPLPAIKASRTQLTMLFTELLTNAYIYRYPGRPLVIDVYCTDEGSRLDVSGKFYRIDIRDNGTGFDPAFNDKIFVLFHRLEGAAYPGGKGAGLALAKRIMANHNGHIEAAGEPGVGAVFSLFFPMG